MKRGVEEEHRGSICLLPLPIGAAVSQTAAHVDMQRGVRWSDNRLGLCAECIYLCHLALISLMKMLQRQSAYSHTFHILINTI